MQIFIKNISKLSLIGLVIASQSCTSSKEALDVFQEGHQPACPRAEAGF